MGGSSFSLYSFPQLTGKQAETNRIMMKKKYLILVPYSKNAN